MSHARERDSHSSSGDEDDSDYNDDGFEGLGIVRANKQPSGLWEALTQETLGELKAHGNETAKQILKKEFLSASDESLIGSAVNQVMRGGTMTMDGRGLARFIKSYNEDQNDPSHSHISSSAGTVSVKNVASKLSLRSQEGYALLVDKSCLPTTPNFIVSLSKVGSDENGKYYTSLEGDLEPQCFVCKLSFENTIERNSRKKKEKPTIKVHHTNPREGMFISDKPSESDFADEYVVYQVTHLYCSTNEKTTMPEFAMPQTVPSNISLTPMWVLGAQKDLYKIHYVLVPKSKLKSDADEINLKKSLAEPSTLYDNGFIQGLVDAVSNSKTISNHPGILAHHKLTNTEEAVLYKVTQVMPILNFKKINAHDKDLMDLLSNTFKKGKTALRAGYLKKNIFHVTGSVLKKLDKKSKSSRKSHTEDLPSYDKVEMDVFINIQNLMIPSLRHKTPMLDLHVFLNHLKEHLVCSERRPDYDYLPACEQFDNCVIGFEFTKNKTKMKCFLEKHFLLEEICTDHYPFTMMAQPDDLNRYRQLIENGDGDKYLDGIICSASIGAAKFFTHKSAEFNVSDVKVGFYNTGVYQTDILRLIILECSSAKDNLLFCNKCFNEQKKLNLYKFVCYFTVAIIYDKEIDIGRVTDKILENIDGNFSFEKLVPDPDDFYTHDVTGTNAVREIVVAIVGTIAWTVTRLLSSHPPDAVRIIRHNPYCTLQEYIQFVCQESGQISRSFQSRVRTPCSFDPAVVIYYLGRTTIPDFESEDASRLEIAQKFVEFVRNESPYKCKDQVDKRTVPCLHVVFTQIQYEHFNEITFIPKHLDTVDEYRTVEGCKVLMEEDDKSEDDRDGDLSDEDGASSRAAGGNRSEKRRKISDNKDSATEAAGGAGGGGGEVGA